MSNQVVYKKGEFLLKIAEEYIYRIRCWFVVMFSLHTVASFYFLKCCGIGQITVVTSRENRARLDYLVIPWRANTFVPTC